MPQVTNSCLWATGNTFFQISFKCNIEVYVSLIHNFRVWVGKRHTIIFFRLEVDQFEKTMCDIPPVVKICKLGPLRS